MRVTECEALKIVCPFPRADGKAEQSVLNCSTTAAQSSVYTEDGLRVPNYSIYSERCNAAGKDRL